MPNHRPSTARLLALVVVASLGCPSRDRPAGDSQLAGSNAPPPCVEASAPATITAGGVGPLKLEAPIDELAGRCVMRDTSFTLGEGIMERGRVVALGGASAVVMLGGDSVPTIARVIVADPSLRTEAGVGVGSDVGAMRAAYGMLCAAMGEGRVVMMAPPLPGVSFAVSQRPSSLPNGGANIDRTPEAIPDSSTITSIWVHGGRTLCGGS